MRRINPTFPDRPTHSRMSPISGQSFWVRLPKNTLVGLRALEEHPGRVQLDAHLRVRRGDREKSSRAGAVRFEGHEEVFDQKIWRVQRAVVRAKVLLAKQRTGQAVGQGKSILEPRYLCSRVCIILPTCPDRPFYNFRASKSIDRRFRSST